MQIKKLAAISMCDLRLILSDLIVKLTAISYAILTFAPQKRTRWVDTASFL